MFKFRHQNNLYWDHVEIVRASKYYIKSNNSFKISELWRKEGIDYPLNSKENLKVENPEENMHLNTS